MVKPNEIIPSAHNFCLSVGRIDVAGSATQKYFFARMNGNAPHHSKNSPNRAIMKSIATEKKPFVICAPIVQRPRRRQKRSSSRGLLILCIQNNLPIQSAAFSPPRSLPQGIFRKWQNCASSASEICLNPCDWRPFETFYRGHREFVAASMSSDTRRRCRPICTTAKPPL